MRHYNVARLLVERIFDAGWYGQPPLCALLGERRHQTSEYRKKKPNKETTEEGDGNMGGTMNGTRELIAQFVQERVEKLICTDIQRALDDGKADKETYASLLRQMYIYIRATVPALCLAYSQLEADHPLADDQKQAIEEEIGHEKLILSDLAAMGQPLTPEEANRIATPASIALQRFHMLAGESGLLPIRCVGLLLETYSAKTSPTIVRGMEQAGVPRGEQEFMRLHWEADIEHTSRGIDALAEIANTPELLQKALHWLDLEATLFEAFLRQAWDVSPMGRSVAVMQ